MKTRRVLGLALLTTFGTVTARGETRNVDPHRSTITIKVFKSGVLSAFGDDHVIRAPLASGEAENGEKPRIEIVVDARRVTVLDPALSKKKRDEVQQRTLGPEVLDVARYPEIRFRSTKVDPLGPGKWRVAGDLTIRDRTAPVSFEVIEKDGLYRGSVRFKQTTFGITPITAGGGTIRVKDELEVDLEIAFAGTGAALSGSDTSERPAR